MSIRYDNRAIRTNAKEVFKEILKNRGIKKVRQYTTPIFNEITSEDRASLDKIQHLWTYGDRLYKLADQYYGDSELWWVIAWYNERPTESHFLIGDVVEVPLPLEDVLGVFYRSNRRGE